MFPMPLNLVQTVIESGAYEKLCGTKAFGGWFALSSFDSRLSEWFACDLRRYDDFLSLAVGGSGYSLLRFHILAVDLNATVLVDRCGDRSVNTGLDNGLRFLAGGAGTWAMISPNFAVVRDATGLVRCVVG